MMLTAILLFVCGIVLLMAEIFLPGAVLGILGGLCLVGSVILGCYAYPDYSVFIITGEVVGTVLFIIAGLYFLPRSGATRMMVLGDSQQADQGWVSNVSNEALVGQTGEVFTSLRPAGSIVINGERIDAVSDGTFIDKGEKVSVIEVHGNRVVVERVQTGAESPPAP